MHKECANLPCDTRFVDKQRLNEVRIRRLMKDRGIPSENVLAERIHVRASTVNRWLSGISSPQGVNLAALCRELDTSMDYAFGRDEGEDQRAAVISDVRRLFGRATAEALEQIQRLTPHHRSIVAGRIVGWVEGLQEQERMPATQFDRDRALVDDEEEPAGGALSEQRDEAPQLAAAPSPSRSR